MSLAVAAIHFLNPAPLMWDLEHPPLAAELAQRYSLRYMPPSQCAAEVLSGKSDLGLIPIASLTPELAIVPGCAIASLSDVRSILLLVKNPGNLPVAEAIKQVRTVTGDTASRSSIAYAHILFERFYGAAPVFTEQPADPVTMLANADAALLIGDPALLAREHRQEIEAAHGSPLLWLDIAALWREHTSLPWVAAVWAVRPESLPREGISSQQLVADLNASRDHGLLHVDDLVREWTPRLPVPAATIHTYLTHNIHYALDAECLQAIVLFRKLAMETGILPPLPDLNLL
ncbi:MAG TPA: menaquinone biosynthesis protein [Acidobacteriaceae bacterium]